VDVEVDLVLARASQKLFPQHLIIKNLLKTTLCLIDVTIRKRNENLFYFLQLKYGNISGEMA
jgi:hypothetical protein